MSIYTSLLYKKSPEFLQNAFLSNRGRIRSLLREGKEFRNFFQETLESQWWDESKLNNYHLKNRSKLLHYICNHVPFYRSNHNGYNNGTAGGLENWSELPLLDKKTVHSHSREFISEAAKKPLLRGSTSGTTGTPLEIFQNLSAVNRENAFIWRQLVWAGMKPGDRRAWIRGDMIVDVRNCSPPYWRMSKSENMLMFSSYHLNKSSAVDYIKALETFDPVIIQAYPSSISFLANFLEHSGERYGGCALQGIVTSSESLMESQRSSIERAFGCKVFDWYGQFERVAAIGTCDHGNYHLISDYSYVELLPERDNLYEIVGTGFNNWAMPLIRYRTGDFVELEPAEKTCPCERKFPLVKRVFGRQDDVIKLPDGRRIGRITHIFEEVEGILEAQIRQDNFETISILIVPSPSYNKNTEKLLHKKARNILGKKIGIDIETTNNIPRTSMGKLRTVISSI